MVDAVHWGGLYKWAEAVQYLNGATNSANWNPVPTGNVQGICPTGWHIPIFNEYQILAQNADPGCDLNCDYGTCSCTTAGDALKATSSHTPIAWDGTDIYGFTALPSGFRGTDGSFDDRGVYSNLWSASPYSFDPSYDSWYVLLYSVAPTRADGGSLSRANGFSVRCLKD